MNEEELVMNNPHLRKLLNKMLDERIQEAKKRGETSESEILTKLTPQSNKRKSSGNQAIIKSPSGLSGNPFCQCFEFCVSVLCLEFKNFFLSISKDAYLFVLQCHVVIFSNK